MKRLAAVAVMVLGCGVGWGQANGTAAMSDSQTLQAILAELQGMHADVRRSQTTEILLTELVVGRGAVEKATEKRDNARSRVSQIQSTQKTLAAQAAQLEQSAQSTMDQAQQTRVAQQQQMLKSNVENFKSQEVDAASALLDAENSLRKEQETLDGIQGQLNDMVQKLR
jgi:predicted  nucleic acid-binding Zn-ribbon protein